MADKRSTKRKRARAGGPGAAAKVPAWPREVAIERAIEWVASGQPLAQWVIQPGAPSRPSFYRWLDEDPAARKRFDAARDVGADVLAERALELLLQPPRKVGGRVDAGYVAWVRAAFDGILKLLSKWNWKRYGDKLALGGDSAMPPIRLSDEERAERVAELLRLAARRQAQKELDPGTGVES